MDPYVTFHFLEEFHPRRDNPVWMFYLIGFLPYYITSFNRVASNITVLHIQRLTMVDDYIVRST